MASKPIEIPFSADTRDLIAGTDDISAAFEDVADSLRELSDKSGGVGDDVADGARDGADGVDKLRRSLEDAQEEAGRTADKGKDAFDKLADSARTAGKRTGDALHDGADRAGDGLEDLRDEAGGTAREVAASFDGSVESIGEGFQEVAANALVGFGPAGAAAGLALAAGVGIGMAKLQEAADKANEFKENVAGMAQALKDAGGQWDMSATIAAMEDYGYAIQDTKEWWELFQDEAKTGFEEMAQLADGAGVSMSDAFIGSFGSLEDSARVLDTLDGKLADLEGQTVKTWDTMGNQLDLTDPKIRAQIDATSGLRDKVRDNMKAQEEAAEIERIRRKAIEGTTAATLEDIDALQKHKSAVRGAEDAELDYEEAKDAATQAIEDNGKTFSKNTEAGRANRRAVLDVADAALEMAKGQLEAGVSGDEVSASLTRQRASLIKTMEKMGLSKEEAERYADKLGLIPDDVVTIIDADTQEARAKVQAYLDEPRRITVQVGASTVEMDNYIRGLNGTRVFINPVPRPGGVGIVP